MTYPVFYNKFTQYTYSGFMQTPLQHVLSSFDDVTFQDMVPMLAMLVVVIIVTFIRRKRLGEKSMRWSSKRKRWVDSIEQLTENMSPEQLEKLRVKMRISTEDFAKLLKKQD